jgi:transcriptional regulator with XRE-family HTH domain
MIYDKIRGMVKRNTNVADYTLLIDWIHEGLKREGWPIRRLGREAGISHSTISLVLSEQQQPTTDFCIAIARAFNVSPITVFALAGIIPPLDDDDVTFQEMLHHMRALSYRDRVRLIRIAREWAKEQRELEEEEEPQE